MDLYQLENCPMDYYCTQDWDTLLKTADPKKRLCTECNETVYFCETMGEFEEKSKMSLCVAFLAFSNQQINELRGQEIPITLGIPTRKTD